MLKDILISAKDLIKKQAEYLQEVDDTEMQHIIVKLNEAYKKPENYIFFNNIFIHNQKKLEQAGYKVEYNEDQREGYKYSVRWLQEA